jgi:hypothetical protein
VKEYDTSRTVLKSYSSWAALDALELSERRKKLSREFPGIGLQGNGNGALGRVVSMLRILGNTPLEDGNDDGNGDERDGRCIVS